MPDDKKDPKMVTDLLEEPDDSAPMWDELPPQGRDMVYAYLQHRLAGLLVQRAEADFGSLVDSSQKLVVDIGHSPEWRKLTAMIASFEAALNELEAADPLICEDCGLRHDPEAPHPSTLS